MDGVGVRMGINKKRTPGYSNCVYLEQEYRTSGINDRPTSLKNLRWCFFIFIIFEEKLCSKQKKNLSCCRVVDVFCLSWFEFSKMEQLQLR